MKVFTCCAYYKLRHCNLPNFNVKYDKHPANNFSFLAFVITTFLLTCSWVLAPYVCSYAQLEAQCSRKTCRAYGSRLNNILFEYTDW